MSRIQYTQSPVWDLVEIIEKKKSNSVVRCLFCLNCDENGEEGTMNGGASRFAEHFMIRGRCSNLPDDEILRPLRLYVKAQEEVISSKRQRDNLDEITSANKERSFFSLTSSTSSVAAVSNPPNDSRLYKIFEGNLQTQTDDKLARGFVAAGIPSNILDNDYFRDGIKAVGQAGPSYKVPPRKFVYDTFLPKETARITEKMGAALKTDFALGVGVSMVSDGKSVHGHPMENFVLVTTQGTYFYDSTDCSAESKDEPFLTSLISEKIDDLEEKFGKGIVSQVILDSGGPNPNVLRNIATKYRHIFVARCAAHCMDLFMEDAGKLPFFSETLEDARLVVKFTMNHEIPSALYRKYASNALHIDAGTRFGTNFILADSLLKAKGPLLTAVNDGAFESFKTNFCRRGREKAENIERYLGIIQQRNFWMRVIYYFSKISFLFELFFSRLQLEQMLKYMWPAYLLLRDLDSAIVGTIGQVYHKGLQLQLHLETNEARIPSATANAVSRCWLLRWEMMSNIQQCTAFLLAPEHLDFDRSRDHPEIRRGFDAALLRIFPDNAESRLNATVELQRYLAREGIFHPERVEIRNAAKRMKGYEFWSHFGGIYPTLQIVAKKILSLAISISDSERNWKEFVHVHSQERNRLSVQRAKDLVFCYHNLRTIKVTSDIDTSWKIRLPVWYVDDPRGL